MSEYESVQKGSLKLKGVSDGGIKKKKKKKKDKDRETKKMLEQISSTGDKEEAKPGPHSSKQTKAELAFEQAQEKRKAELILKKASKTHKERILDFNRHLDTLTEHFDIPKVSWTK